MKPWTIFVDAVTFIWLVVFTVGFSTSSAITAERCGLVSLLLLPVFVIDLYILFRQSDNFRSFIKQRWFDVLIAIPYFRLFRILKFARVLRALRLVKMAKVLGITRAAKKTRRAAKVVKKADNKMLKADAQRTRAL